MRGSAARRECRLGWVASYTEPGGQRDRLSGVIRASERSALRATQLAAYLTPGACSAHGYAGALCTSFQGPSQVETGVISV